MPKHLHYWLETGIPHWLVVANGKYRYDCAVCDKRVWSRYHPLNPQVPSAWQVYNSEVAKGNAHLVMSPPMLIGQEPDYTTGERYKKLVRF